MTGILATMPYIALQLVGMQVVLEVMGIGTDSGNWFVKDLPLFIAFIVLAAYTYSSGLRAPALIAFVKDTLIYIVIIVAVLLPARRSSAAGTASSSTASDSFADVQHRERRRHRGRRRGAEGDDPAGRRCSGPTPRSPSGSALALFMYPHSVTGVLSTRSRSVIRRNAALLPAYSFLLGPARAARLRRDRGRASRSTNPQQSVPQLFENEFSPVVRRRRVRGDRDRRAGAGGDHVDRGGEPVDPQRLQGLHQPRRDATSRRRRRASWCRCW